MLASLIHRTIEPISRIWVSESPRSWRTLPVPTDQPHAHAAGNDPDRLLLIGSGPAVSYGVASYNLGLAGHLARQVSMITSRGASVFVRADSDLTVPGAVAALGQIDVGRFDAIVATLGGLEALTLLPVRQWRTMIDDFISASTVPVYLVAIPPIASIVRMPPLYGSLVTAHARRLNAETEAAVRFHSRATFVPFVPRPGDLVNDANKGTYAEWSELIAPRIASGLTESLRREREHRPIDEAARQASLDAMGVVDSGQNEELQRIVDSVRELFSVSGASVNIIDNSRQWVMATANMSPEDRPRDEAICNVTVDKGELYVIRDTRDYPLAPWASAVGDIRFYAGYPIDSPEGQRIGALCIVDTKPRDFDDTDRALLRDLAIHTQTVLWMRALRA